MRLGFFTVLYPIGIPCVFFFSLRQYAYVTVDGVPLDEARKSDPDAGSALVKNPQIQEQLGFLYARFKPDYWWYETSEVCRKFLLACVTMFIFPGTATQSCAAIAFNTYYLCQLLVCWPFKAYDDNMIMSLSLIATSVTLFGSMIIQSRIDVMDQYQDGVTTGILLGSTIVLFILYFIILVRYQLPFVCTWFMPECIRDSCLNPYRPPKPPGEPVKNDTPSFGCEPPPPLPDPPEDVEEKNEQCDSILDEYFTRYDLDQSGTINTYDELKNLTTNLSFKIRLALSGEEIDAIVDSAGIINDQTAWSLEDFSEWYKYWFLAIGEDGTTWQGDAAMAITLMQEDEVIEQFAAHVEEEQEDDDDGD